ncbi:GNAT family N-acetyltransferase [Streptomyces sp. NPDC048639]|uniref:GNAT family N-acetyltransferase n=1 Tax=Streptomyces sp. NPDC048639 TaxID=3365581 RepID=UPI00371CF29B
MFPQTDRLSLRRFRPEDAPALAAYRSVPEVARYQSWISPVPVEAADALVRSYAAGDPSAPGWFQYAVELKDDGALVGDVGVGLHENRMQAEIGFTLAPNRQGHGYAGEAIGAVLRDLFERRNLHRVSAECDARNLPSARLLERVGFQREGLRPEFTWLKGEWTDDLLFGLLAERWRTLTA